MRNMAITAAYADAANQKVNLWLTTDSVRPGLALNDPEVVSFLANGGVIAAYTVPPPAQTLTDMDLLELNRVLAMEGSVFRGFVEVMLDEINILRTRPASSPALQPRTLNQIKPAIQNKMRTP